MNNGLYKMGLSYDNEHDYEPCSKKILPSLFAWFVLLSASSTYFTLVLPLYFDIYGEKNFNLFLLLIIGQSVLFLFVLINFCASTFIDPGRFPKEISENCNQLLNAINYKNVIINDINVRMKWCNTCKFYRPPRSSHCGMCNACIDIMDHHCPWISNCIGRRNYKYFLIFLISLTLHMIIIFSMSLTIVLLKKENFYDIPVIASILLIILISILIIPIGGLTGFHIILVSRGRTTNEQVTGKFRTGVNPFDQGFFKNWKLVLCTSMPPSFIKFHHQQLNVINYNQAKTLLQIYPPEIQKEKNMQNMNSLKIKSNIAKSLRANNKENNYQKQSGLQKAQIKNIISNQHQQNELELRYNNYLNSEIITFSSDNFETCSNNNYKPFDYKYTKNNIKKNDIRFNQEIKRNSNKNRNLNFIKLRSENKEFDEKTFKNKFIRNNSYLNANPISSMEYTNLIQKSNYRQNLVKHNSVKDELRITKRENKNLKTKNNNLKDQQDLIKIVKNQSSTNDSSYEITV